MARIELKQYLVSLAATAAALLTCLMPATAVANNYYNFGYSSLLGSKYNLVGRELNGTGLGGQPLDGRLLSHASLGDATLDGEPLTEIRLDESRLEARIARGRGHGPVIRDHHLAGARFTGHLADGGTLALRLDAMVRGDNRWTRDVTGYQVSYQTADGWQPLCGTDDEGHSIPAIPLTGRWDLREGTPGGGAHHEDPDALTFACATHVLGHCVLAGYAPWRTARICQRPGRCETITLRDHHQTCTRMMRADYCGDGTPHTHDGIEIGLHDNLGIRYDGDDWLFEAEWDPTGARCLSEERIPGLVPHCAEALAQPDCGDPTHLGNGALIFTEVPPGE